MTVKNLFSILAFFIAFSLFAGETEFSNVIIDEEFLPFFKAKKSLMSLPGVKEFTSPGKKSRIIVCVTSMAASGTSSLDIKKMTEICRLKAQLEFLRADGVHMSSYYKVDNRLTVIGEGKQQKIKSLSTYLNVVEERVSGFVKGLPVVGRWFSKDKSVFYLAIGTILKDD